MNDLDTPQFFFFVNWLYTGRLMHNLYFGSFRFVLAQEHPPPPFRVVDLVQQQTEKIET